jgi:hypothetical protein
MKLHNNGSRSIDSISSSVRPGPHSRIAMKAPISAPRSGARGSQNAQHFGGDRASLTGVSSRLKDGHNRDAASFSGSI